MLCGRLKRPINRPSTLSWLSIPQISNEMKPQLPHVFATHQTHKTFPPSLPAIRKHCLLPTTARPRRVLRESPDLFIRFAKSWAKRLISKMKNLSWMPENLVSDAESYYPRLVQTNRPNDQWRPKRAEPLDNESRANRSRFCVFADARKSRMIDRQI